MDKTEVKSAPEPGSPSTAEPRENLITTAVKFLQNPKVRQSPFQQRKAFLVRKGLTEEEINIAVERSGTGSDATAVEPVFSQPHPAQPALVSSPQPASVWSRGRDYLASAIVVGGVSYAVYIFYKKYVAPHWFGPSKEQQQLNELTRGMAELQRTISDTLTHIQETQSMLTKQQDIMQNMAKNYASSRGPLELGQMQESQAVTEMKEEIKSLKALLLSSRRFPAAPTTTPVLPSWQLTPTTSQVSTPTGQTETKVTEATQGNRTSETETSLTTSEGNNVEAETSLLGQSANTNETTADESEELQDVTASQKVVAGESTQDDPSLPDQNESEASVNILDLENANIDQSSVEVTAQ